MQRHRFLSRLVPLSLPSAQLHLGISWQAALGKREKLRLIPIHPHTQAHTLRQHIVVLMTHTHTHPHTDIFCEVKMGDLKCKPSCVFLIRCKNAHTLHNSIVTPLNLYSFPPC